MKALGLLIGFGGATSLLWVGNLLAFVGVTAGQLATVFAGGLFALAVFGLGWVLAGREQ